MAGSHRSIWKREWTKTTVEIDSNALLKATISKKQHAPHPQTKSDDEVSTVSVAGVTSSRLLLDGNGLIGKSANGSASDSVPAMDVADVDVDVDTGVGVVLSPMTEEWWRWVLVRITSFSEFVPAGPDTAAQHQFVGEWQPDLFEWAGDQRWNVNEWARLHGIAMAVDQELEYEEAQYWCNLSEPNIVNETWGSNGMAVDIDGQVAVKS